MTRMSAYRLRRAPYAAAFARAWDVARERAGTLIEDIAFERAIEGVEHETYNSCGELAGSRTVYNDRLLTYLLRHLKPERYGRDAHGARPTGAAWQDADRRPPAADAPPALECETAPERRGLPAPDCPASTLDQALRAMEPGLPAPVEAILDSDELAHELLCAEIGDGKLAHFHSEQRPAKSPERLRAERIAAQRERGRLADEKQERGEHLAEEEFADWCAWIDPSQAGTRRRKPRDGRKGVGAIGGAGGVTTV